MSFQRPDVLWLAVLAFLVLILQGLVNETVVKRQWRAAIFIGLLLFVVVLLLQVQTASKTADVTQLPSSVRAVTSQPRRIEPPKPRIVVHTVSDGERPARHRTAPPVAARPTIVYVHVPPVIHPPSRSLHPAKASTAASDKARQLALLAGAAPKPALVPCTANARVLSTAAPVVPPEISPVVARTARVTVRVQLDAHGEVTSTTVLRSSGSAALDQAAMNAAGKNSFEPARLDCYAVESHLDVSETFGR